MPKSPTRARAAGLCLLAFVFACSDDSTSVPDEPQVASVAVSPESVDLHVGETATFSATVLDDEGAPMEGATVSWSSDDASVTISNAGVATAVAAGSAEITATVGDVSGTATVNVTLVPVARVAVEPDTVELFVGHTASFSAVAYDADEDELSGRAVAWTTSNSAIATVSSAGVATAHGAGTATITATIGGIAGTATLVATVNPVLPTSYENFKEVGVEPSEIPLPATPHWGFHELARGYGDFFDDGELDMFTATVDYDLADGPDGAARAVYRFWRRDASGYVEDASILPAGTTCLHPRKALVADFNQDGRPDIYVACHGYDGDPFPGEENQLLLSQESGGYSLRVVSEAGFWHGASAADLNDDGYPDVVAVAGGQAAVFINNGGDGTFALESAGRLPDFAGRVYFTVELIDVDEDGEVDLVLGGHEWEGYGEFTTTPTAVYINPGSNDWSNVDPVVVPAVPNEGVVVDFAVTGTGASRTLWVNRTSGGDGTFYQSLVLQRYDWATGASAVVLDERPAQWVPWILPYTRGGASYVGSDDLRTPLEWLIE
ncbi:MAG TPA: Ig-like domain-containing protein [Longimicrobiales bacterium]